MNLSISSQLAVAASHCARKVYFLLRREPQPRPHEYVQVVEERTARHRAENLPTDAEERFIIVAGDLAAQCDAVEKTSRSKREPHLAIGTHTPTPSDKLRLAFAGCRGSNLAYAQSIGASERRVEIPLGGHPFREL